MSREYIIGPYIKPHPSMKSNLYNMAWKIAYRYAESIHRELAEGPTVLISDNYFGPVELWPLVWRGNALSG